MFEFIFDKLYSRAEYLPVEERTTIIIGVIFAFVRCLLDLLFLFIFIQSGLYVMASFNALSLLIGVLNIYIFLGTKFTNFALTLMILNTCLYIGFSTFLLGYDKNANILLPLMILVSFYFYSKNPKFLAINLFGVFFVYCFNLYVKYRVTSMYHDVADNIDYVNDIFAILGTFWFIYSTSKIEAYAKSYTDNKIKNLSVEVNQDYLTGLKNRRYMESFLSSNSFQPDAYLVLADIDFFKRINDNNGHNCGDHVLKEVSKILSSKFKVTDPISRWGGEEFLIFINNEPELDIKNLLDELRTQVEKHEFIYNGLSLYITITFGYTKINMNYNIEKNIRNADIALYYGKETGRNKVVNFQNVLKNENDVSSDSITQS